MAVMSFSVNQNHLTSLITIIKNAPPDLVLISENGSKIRTWKLLLSLFSVTVTELVQNELNNTDDNIAISCPVKKNEIETLVNMLENSDSNERITGNDAFGILGIDVAELDITTNTKMIDIVASVVDMPTFVEDIHHERIDKKEESIKNEKIKEKNSVSNTFKCHLCDS